jgi:hypothetical protein
LPKVPERTPSPVRHPNWVTSMYGYMGVNEADITGSGSPDFVVRFLDFASLRNSVGGVVDYVRKSHRNQRGVVVRLDVTVTKEITQLDV